MVDPVETIVSTLSPFIGANMSRAVVMSELSKIGTQPEQLSASDLERIVKTLALGLNVFVGNAKSVIIAEDMRKKLGLASGGKA